MFSCFWATGDSKVFKWKTGSAVGGARPSQQVQSVCITHLGKPLEMWKMLNVLGSKHFIAVRHNWSVKTFMNLTTTFNYTLWFCILKSQNVPKSPQITPEVPKIMHLSHFFPMCILLQLSANSLSLLSSTNELIVAFEITLFFWTLGHTQHIIHHAEDWDVDFFFVLVHGIWILEEDFCQFIHYCILYFRSQLLAW